MAFGCTITVQTGKIPSSQSDFVWLATEDNFPAAAIDGGSSSILNGGGNLRCYTDSTKATQLPIEVVTFVTGGTPSVQVWGLSSSLGVGGTVYCEADSVAITQPTVTDAYGRNAVWVDYFAVYHGVDLIDSSGNGNNLTAFNGAQVNSNSSFELTAASSQYFSVDSATGLTSNSVTISGSISPKSDTGIGQGVAQLRAALSDDSSDSYRLTLQDNVANNPIRAQVSNEAVGVFFADTTVGASFSSYNYCSSTFTETDLSVYLNGSNSSSASGSSTLSFGAIIVGAWRVSVSPTQYANAFLKDVLFYNGLKSAGAIESEYNNQSDPSTFWSTSSWTDSGGGITVTESLVNSNYTSNDPSITLTGNISISETLVNSNYSSLNPTITLTGVISISESTVSTEYTSINPIIDFTGLVAVSESVTNSDYTSLDPVITLTSGAIQITEQVVGAQYQAKPPSILLTPPPLPIVSTVCFNGYIQELIYNGFINEVSFNGTAQELIYNGNMKDVVFNGTIQTTCCDGNIKTDC